MKYIYLLISFTLIGCVTSSNQSTYNGEIIQVGTYKGFFKGKWYADDVTDRSFMDVESYLSNSTSTGNLYLINGTDTSILCEGSFNWKQRESNLLFWNTQQRCKDPDLISDPFGAWDISVDTVSRTIKNITKQKFDMQGSTVNGILFWATYNLIKNPAASHGVLKPGEMQKSRIACKYLI